MNSVKLYGRLTKDISRLRCRGHGRTRRPANMRRISRTSFSTNPLTISKNIAGREAGPSSKDGSGRS